MSTKIEELSPSELAKMTPIERLAYKRELDAQKAEEEISEIHGRLLDPTNPDPVAARLRTTLPLKRPEITERAFEYLAKVQAERESLWFAEFDNGKAVDPKSLWRVVNVFPVMGAEQRGPNLMVHLAKHSAEETVEGRDGKQKPKPKTYAATPLANGEKTQTFISGLSYLEKPNENELSVLGDDFVKRFKQHVITV